MDGSSEGVGGWVWEVSALALLETPRCGFCWLVCQSGRTQSHVHTVHTLPPLVLCARPAACAAGAGGPCVRMDGRHRVDVHVNPVRRRCRRWRIFRRQEPRPHQADGHLAEEDGRGRARRAGQQRGHRACDAEADGVAGDARGGRHARPAHLLLQPVWRPH
eukprot:365145-Chlamydomonas_euryale.AAC.9